MSWILPAAIMFVASVAMYLLVRHSSRLGVGQVWTNLAMFVVPVLVFGFMALGQPAVLKVSLWQAAVIIIAAIFCSYLGNRLSLRSIELAPNPGYSLIIGKSYVLMTSIAAIWLFHSRLSLQAAIGIGVIVVFAAVMLLEQPKVKRDASDSRWLWLAIGSFICWGMLALSSKYLLTIGVNVLARLLLSMTIVSVIIGGEMHHQRNTDWKQFELRQWLVLLSIGVLSAAFNYFMQVGYNLAPNIGYINALNAASIGAIAIGSAVLYGDQLSVRKLVGIAGMIVGVVLVVM